ncbi:MAG: tetratricopeptide repeat protein, partial [Leptolyngbyaceae cyanobacterium SU_3_3]|nr:tetratricopeptide repeat protein [Leptolyngbyaceae cyanobacterium SU_3_3]
MSQEPLKWDEVTNTPEEEYQALQRSLRRRRGFGLLFVRCSPAQGAQLVQQIERDLPLKKIGVLAFKEAIEDGNFYQRAADYLQEHSEVDTLFVQGLEYSLLSYERQKREESGWSSEDIYNYSWKAVPKLLGNLNLRREQFRDDFPTVCFVFLLPLFALTYLANRAPDFFDWRSGVYEFPIDPELLEQESLRLVQESNFDEYLNWAQPERDGRIAEIKCWIEEPGQTPERKARLFFEQASLFYASAKYEAAIASLDQALKYKPDNDIAWYNRG